MSCCIESIDGNMRIVFDNIVFSLQRRGGISVVWKEIVSRFIKNKCDDITLVEYETNKKNMFHEAIPFTQDMVLMKHTFIFLYLERYLDLRLNIQEPFIFHSSYFRLCNNKNAINITTVHDFTYEYVYKGRKNGAFMHLWQRNRAIRKADAVVCISENTKRDLLKFLPDVPLDKVYVIYNGVSKEYRVIEDKIKGIQNHLLFVGARAAYKNGLWLAEAIKDTDYKVIFCGGAMKEDEKVFYDRILGPNRYEVKVGLSNEDLNRYYNSVKCLVYPSSYEGFGIPIVEAQSAGCPVIAYNTSSIPEVIGDRTLLMNDLTKEELLNKLLLLDNDKVRKDVIKKGLENVNRFSWDLTFKSYRDLYQKLLYRK